MTKRTITIRIKANRSGRPVAHYWGSARRWLPLSIAAAEAALATGEIFGCRAVPSETTAAPLPPGYTQSSIDGDVFDRR